MSASRTKAAWARDQRAREWMTRAIRQAMCPTRHCGGMLVDVVDGRTQVRCPRCERRKAGICRDCPRGVDGIIGRASLCATCRVRSDQSAKQRYERRHQDTRSKRQHGRYNPTPGFLALKRADAKRRYHDERAAILSRIPKRSHAA